MCISSNAPSKKFQAILKITGHSRILTHQYGPRFKSCHEKRAAQCIPYLHLAVKPNAATPVPETDPVSWQLIRLLHLPEAGDLTTHPTNNKLAEERRDLDRTSTGQAVCSADDIQPTNKF
jgi:hypothetical protein